jgi:flagellar biosynthetic protein FlhB
MSSSKNNLPSIHHWYFELELSSSIIHLDPLQFDDSAEKSEEPTPKRLQQARDKGNVPKSQDLTTAVSVILVTLFIYSMLHNFYGAVEDMFLKSAMMFSIPDMTNNDFWHFFVTLAGYWYLMMTPLFFVVIVVTLTVQILQVGLQFSTESLMPDISKFNPVSGLKKIIGKEAFVELLRSLAKLSILSYFPYSMFVEEYPTITYLFGFTLGAALDYMSWLIVKLILQVGLVMVIYGIFDFLWSQHRHVEDNKMSKQEVKEERKQSEGDPQIKGRIRQKQRELAQQQMMGEVPKADVVVTNPTHYAVALSYDRSVSDEPRVVAKGVNLIAQKIKEIANENQVPIIEDKPLARALYAEVELGQAIPEDLFQTVAIILAQAYKMSGKTHQR